MSNFIEIQNSIRNLIGEKFGNFYASDKALSNQNYHRDRRNLSSSRFINIYLDKKGDIVAISHGANYNSDNLHPEYQITDYLTQKIYKGSGKNGYFQTITLSEYNCVILDNTDDKRNKGKIDLDDNIGLFSGRPIKIRDFLNCKTEIEMLKKYYK